jgi:hypothetical protein
MFVMTLVPLAGVRSALSCGQPGTICRARFFLNGRLSDRLVHPHRHESDTDLTGDVHRSWSKLGIARELQGLKGERRERRESTYNASQKEHAHAWSERQRFLRSSDDDAKQETPDHVDDERSKREQRVDRSMHSNRQPEPHHRADSTTKGNQECQHHNGVLNESSATVAPTKNGSARASAERANYGCGGLNRRRDRHPTDKQPVGVIGHARGRDG